MDPRRPDPTIAAWAVAVALMWTWLGSGWATAQVVEPKANRQAPTPAPKDPADAKEDKDSSAQNVFSRPDRISVQRLTRSEQLVEQGRYAEAVRNLGAILESTEDFFLPGSAPVRRSLRLEAQALLGRMPRAGRELYELEFGARARQMLSEAAAAGDPLGLAEVARRFFHTQAGYEATLLLGLYHLDHASPLAGALTLARLQEVSAAADEFEPALSLSLATCWLRAGMPEKAKQTLARLKSRHPGATVQIGGKPVALFSQDSQALDWLANLTGIQAKGNASESRQWAMVGGDATRNAAVVGSGPLLSLRWRVSCSDDPYVEALVEQLAQSPRDQEALMVPGLQPLVVGGLVLMRTAKNLLAVDFRTGKQLWEVPVDDPFENMRAPSPDLPLAQPIPFDSALKYRIWGDLTYGALSSDGQRVFAIEDLPLDAGSAMTRHFFNFPAPRNQTGPRPFNRLAAFNVRTGKLEWHLGGAGDEFGLPQAGTFFLGAPLPLMDRLYVIGETRGEIRLLALDSKGHVVWTQQLAVADRDILNDLVRRLSGVSPSYADGILVCPTANRSIVALELATRSLLWGYTYNDKTDRTPPQIMFSGFRSADLDLKSRWADSKVVLAEGCALATPADSSQVHCLNLIDGKFLWSQPREDDVYLACVHQGKAILVGQRRVHALGLKTGKPAWDQAVELPTGSSPSGIGFLNGDVYYVPLSSAEVMAVDLKQGRIAHVSKSRQGNVPGNLVCCDGMVVSQRPYGLEVFSQMEALRKQVTERLAANPKDAESLSLRGEIHWDEGRLQDAIADFRRSLEISADPKARNLLRDAMFEGLRADFARHRKSIAEIDRLIDDSQQRATLFRLLATGCENVAEYHSAFGHYMKLVDLDRDRRDMENVDKFLAARRDCWIQVRLAALREAAPPDVKAEIDREVERRRKAAADEKASEALARFLDYFDGLPAAAPARSQWISRLRRAGRFLQAELLLLRQHSRRDPQQAGAAVAELASMLVDAERFQDAAVAYRRLETEFADVVCADGKTGRQLTEALPAAGPVRRLLDLRSPWPAGEVLVEKAQEQRRFAGSYSRGTLEFLGAPSPFFSDLSLEWQQNPQQVVACDGLGQRRWQLPLAELIHRGQFNPSLMRACARGHLLLISMGHSILAADAWGSSPDGSPRVLWSHDLNDPVSSQAARQQVRVQVANLVGVQRDPFGLAGNRYGFNPAINLPAVLNERIVCFQRFRSCVALHPLTGETLWVRQDIRPDSTILGDEQYVFVVPPDQGIATVLRAADGELVGQRQVPADRIATFGRCALVWRDTDTEATLELIDPWDGHIVWGSRAFAAHSKVSIVENELVAVFEPGGRFTVVEVASGRFRVDAKLQPENALADIHVLRSPDGYVLVTSGAERDERGLRRSYALHGMSAAQVSRGNVYAFDSQGKPLWPNPVKVEDQFLLLAQPKRLPVITFACTAQIRKPDGTSQHNTAILCIDRQTGRVLVREDIPGGTGAFQLTGDPQKKTVQLRLQRDAITMTFTGKPISAQSPAEGAVRDRAAEARKKPKPRGLLEAIQRAAQGTWEKTFGAPFREDAEAREEDRTPLPVAPRKKPSAPRKEEKRKD